MSLISKDKQKFLKLQNFLLHSDEKKLMVSMDLLMQTAGLYIKNHRKAITEDLIALKNTQRIGTFFARYDHVISVFDEMIEMEEFFDYLPPLPSEEKKRLEGMLEGLLEGLIKRQWEYCNTSGGYDPQTFMKLEGAEIYQNFFSLFEKYMDRLSPTNIKTIEELKGKVLIDDNNEVVDAKSNAHVFSAEA